jgi:hypothetical protein
MAVYAIFIFFSATVPLLTVACALYAFIRHGVDALNLITVYRKEIDSQGHLISAVTNTVLILVVAYQVCMASFLAVKQCDSESLTIVALLVFSILYIVIGYEKVNDHGEFEN